MKIAFITWDGPGTFYHESLFLPLLCSAFSPKQIHVMQFGWGDAERKVRLAALAKQSGFTYRHINVRKGVGSPITALSLLFGLAWVVNQTRGEEELVVVARSTIPGALVALLRAMRCSRGLRFVYDADGLPADERAEFSGWNPHGLPYKALTLLDRASIKQADRVTVRSTQAIKILATRTGTPSTKFRVIKTGVDSKRFSPGSRQSRMEGRNRLSVAQAAPTIIYAGSIGGKYDIDYIFRLAREIQKVRTDTHLIILTGRQAHQAVKRRGAFYDVKNLIIREVDPQEVPSILAIGDLGIAPIAPTFSMRAVAPIKVAEYSLCGLPFVAFRGVGDLDAEFQGSQVALMVNCNEVSLPTDWFISSILPQRESIRDQARQVGLQLYDLATNAAGWRDAILD